MNNEFESTVDPNQEQDPNQQNDSNQPRSANYNAAPELEVVKDKAGPDNQVVYKYQGEFFYIDREDKKLVKVEKSELKDAEHEIIIKDGSSEEDNSDNNDKKRKDKKDDQ